MKARTIITAIAITALTLALPLIASAQASGPFLVSTYHPTYYPYPMNEGFVENVALSGDYAYVSVMGAHTWITDLRVVDIANKSAPREVGRYQSWNRISDLAVVGNYAYLVFGFMDQGGAFQIIDISNPRMPTLVGTLSFSGDLWAVAVAYPYAYVGSSNALRVVNVSDPAHPALVTTYSTAYPVNDIVIMGSYAYIAGGESGLRIINVTDPSNPIASGSCDTPGKAFGIDVSGPYVYVADQTGGLRIIDVSVPTAPVEVGHYTTSWATGVAVSGNYAYVSDHYNGLYIFRVTNPATPAQVGHYSTRTSGVATSGFYVYVTTVVEGYGMPILWFAPPASTSIPTSGGSFASEADHTTYTFPAGTFTDTVIITHTARFIGEVPSLGNMVGISHFFESSAVYSSTGQPAQPASGQTYTITVRYTDAERGPVIENTLALYWWDGSQWVKEPSSEVDTVANTVTAAPNHLSLWAVLGETRRVYLPLVMKGH